MVVLLGDVLPKRVACPSRGDSPTTSIVGIRPQQVTHGALVRNLVGVEGGTRVALYGWCAKRDVVALITELV